MGRYLGAALLAVMAAGCTTIGHEKVEGWPALDIVEHYVSAGEVYERCRRYVGAGMLPLACAEFNFAAKRCDLWLNAGFAPRFVVKHERLHCRGYDHPGETSMRDMLQRYLMANTLPQRSSRADW